MSGTSSSIAPNKLPKIDGFTCKMGKSESNGEIHDKYTETTEAIRSKLSADLKCPVVGIVCGSGLGGLGGQITGSTVDYQSKPITIDYEDIPHFPRATGKILFVSHA